MRYSIAHPDEYLAITGMGISTVKITKSTWVWPLQRCMRFSVQPADYAMNLQAMTLEKLQFQVSLQHFLQHLTPPNIHSSLSSSLSVPT